MRILILYFSGTGNTRWLAGYLKHGFEERGYSTDLKDIADESQPDYSSYGLIGLAHPIYGSGLPGIVGTFLEQNADVRKRIEFVFTTFGYVNGLGYFAERKLISDNIKWYFNIRMFNNVSTPERENRIVSPEERLAARKKIENIIDGKLYLLLEKKNHIDGLGPQLIAGTVIRRFFRNKLKNHYKSLSVDMQRCAKCQKCISDCPTGSISETAGYFMFADTCTACMRCYNNCPAGAILINGCHADPQRYTRYTGPWGVN